MVNILDCTLRDGGYYTNWDFSNDIVDAYINATNELPVNYLELGYRNNPTEEYLGKFGYSPTTELRRLRNLSKKKLAVMLNEKSTAIEDLDYLIKPIQGYVDMIRLAVDPKNFDRAVKLASAVKSYGFEVGFNMMYMSKWHEYDGLISNLHKLNGIADMFNMVDSFGGVKPKDVRDILSLVRQNTDCPVGFHGHNNLQLALINTLTAIDCGVDSVDATILGMGRGAGNLNMELLLTYLNEEGLKVDFNVLGDAITAFQPLFEKYRWGTNLPYMISGANSIPQKEVMAWVTNRTYSFNSIVRALDNRKNKIADNARYPLFEGRTAQKVILIGGGESVVEHKDAIREYVGNNPDIALIFVTARHINYYMDLSNDKYICLVGNEAKRMKANIPTETFNDTCILSPYPRTMGTEVPAYAESRTFELRRMSFTNQYVDSCTAVALQTAIDLEAQEVELVGYDGYSGGVLSEKEADLSKENRILFRDFSTHRHCQLISLTPTLYKDLKTVSIYQFL